MKRIYRASYAQVKHLLHHRHNSQSKTLIHPLGSLAGKKLTRGFNSDAGSNSGSQETHLTREQLHPDPARPRNEILAALFAGKWHYAGTTRKGDLANIQSLKDELLSADGCEGVSRVLIEKGEFLLKKNHLGRSAFVELLFQLRHDPKLSVEVLNWRRRQQDLLYIPMTSEEYAKGIVTAGRSGNVDLALDLSKEVGLKGIQTTSTYNALMAAYMYNGFSEKCQSVFEALKGDEKCIPTIVTYNILISVYGALMLVDHMEATFNEVKELNLSPNLKTYERLIAGYITAWMWDNMERTFEDMKASNVEPATSTYLLMLRGYAHSGQLDKMEDTYLSVKDHVDQYEYPLIRTMICSYCKCQSPSTDQIQRIEELLNLIPENEYRPWLNVVLIKLYAQEYMLERMEDSIDEAFLHNTCVTTGKIMRSIVTCYFRRNEVDKLTTFVRRAEGAGWKICRTLYHSRMIMYGSQKRIAEMEKVLDEMKEVRIQLTKKTFCIMCNVYLHHGQTDKLPKMIGMMLKHGHEFPLELFPSQ